MGGENSVPVTSETASPLPIRNTECHGASDATDGDTTEVPLENEYLATVNALQDRLDVLERLVLVQHRSEDVLQQKIEVIEELRNIANSLEKNPHIKVVIATTTTTSTDIPSVYRGTPTVMSKTAPTTAPTKTFLVTDVIQVVRICNEIGETPIGQKLRKMGTDFED